MGWARTPLVSLVLRDGVLVFTLLAGEYDVHLIFLSGFTHLVGSQVLVSLIIVFELRQSGMGVLIWNAVFSYVLLPFPGYESNSCFAQVVCLPPLHRGMYIYLLLPLSLDKFADYNFYRAAV